LRKEIFNVVKKEMVYIGLLLISALAIFKIIYFKENMITLIRTVFSLFWLFVLPSYFAMLYWHDKLEFMERFVIGIAATAAVIGIFSYYIGLFGLNIKYHGIVLPLLIILIGSITALNKKNFSAE